MVRGAAEQAGSMEEFKQGSDEIENIIRTIDNIAFQTNILVLNTAVEATVNRITLCFCPAGDCVLAGLPCQLVQLLQFLPQSAYGFRRNFSLLIAPAHAEKAPVPHVDGDEQRFPAVSDIHPHHLAPPLLCRSASDLRTPTPFPTPKYFSSRTSPPTNLQHAPSGDFIQSERIAASENTRSIRPLARSMLASSTVLYILTSVSLKLSSR